MVCQIRNVAFANGGLKHLAYLGTIKVLASCQLIEGIKGWGGASIGSLYALLGAIGCKHNQIHNIVFGLDINHFLKVKTSIMSPLKKYYGIYDTTNINGFITNICGKYAGNPDLTFEDIYNKYSTHLVVNALELNSHSITNFDYLSFPKLPVRKAIEASCAIPFMFKPVKISDRYYCDSSYLKNTFFDVPYITFSLSSLLSIDDHYPKNFQQYLFDFILSLYKNIKYIESSNVAIINCNNINHYSVVNKYYLIVNGINKTTKFLMENNYINGDLIHESN